MKTEQYYVLSFTSKLVRETSPTMTKVVSKLHEPTVSVSSAMELLRTC